jgi:hypothetical protein
MYKYLSYYIVSFTSSLITQNESVSSKGDYLVACPEKYSVLMIRESIIGVRNLPSLKILREAELEMESFKVSTFNILGDDEFINSLKYQLGNEGVWLLHWSSTSYPTSVSIFTWKTRFFSLFLYLGILNS